MREERCLQFYKEIENCRTARRKGLFCLLSRTWPLINAINDSSLSPHN